VDFKELVRLARRRWKTVVIMTLLGVVIGGAISFIATPKYSSTAKLFISTDVGSSAEAYYGSAFGSARVQSYADLATSGEVMQRVIDKLHLNLNPGELAGEISAEVPTSTVLIKITATDTNARAAQQIAQATAEVLSSYISDVETLGGRAVTPVKVTVTDPANYNGSPVSPHTVLNVAVGLALGLLIGSALAIGRDLLDTTVKSPEDLKAVSDLPSLSHIAFDPDMESSPLLVDGSTHAPRAEAFRVLRTNLQFLNVDKTPKSFVITSAVPSEGKTSTSTNLAIALAQTGKRVLLVEGDLRRPRLSGLLGLEASVGLTTVLVGRSELADAIQHHNAGGIDFLASGPIPPNPTEILQSQATRTLFARLREAYDAVVVDAPPLLPVADAAIMANDVDGAIMVVRHGKTTREQVRYATERLNHVGADLFGFVVNMTPRHNSRSYGYGDSYGYYEQIAPTSRRKSK